MFAVPAATPVTMPALAPEPTVAIDVLLLLHVPPVEVLLRVIVAATHTLFGPVIGVGTGFTVIVVVLSQAKRVVYLIVSVPGVIPVTMPEDEPTVAIKG